jgi:predicted nucleic acid-binding protein
MEVVTDASALLAVVLDEPERPAIIEATAGATLMAPEALPFAVGNALTAMLKRGRLEAETAMETWSAAQRIPVQLLPVQIDAAIALAATHGMYAYDGYYLQCALAHRRPLVTLDRRLQQVAAELGVRNLV